MNVWARSSGVSGCPDVSDDVAGVDSTFLAEVAHKATDVHHTVVTAEIELVAPDVSDLETNRARRGCVDRGTVVLVRAL